MISRFMRENLLRHDTTTLMEFNKKKLMNFYKREKWTVNRYKNVILRLDLLCEINDPVEKWNYK